MPALSTDDSASSTNASPVTQRRHQKWRDSPCHSPQPRSPPDRGSPSPPTILYPTQPATATSPPAFASTLSTLRRNLSSQFSLIPEDRAVHITSVSRDGHTYQFRREAAAIAHSPIDRSDAASVGSTDSNSPPRFTPTTRRSLHHMFASLLLWWPLFIVGLVRRTFRLLFAAPFVDHPQQLQQQQPPQPPQPPQSPFIVRCVSSVLHLGLTVILNLTKHAIRTLSTSAAERHRRKRTVLIGGGSSMQALHLARNFHAAGYRVVAADVAGATADGGLPLAGFSTAVSRYYTLPAPPSAVATEGAGAGRTSAYVGRLCDIAEAEQPVLYVPVCERTAVRCDALAKPHLVLRGCQTFCPGAQECAVLDDLAELLHQCRRLRLSVPPHCVVRSVPELLGQVYDDAGWAATVQSGGRVRLHAMGGRAVPAIKDRLPVDGEDRDCSDDDDDDESDDEDDDEDRRSVVLPKRRERADALLVAALPIGQQLPWLVVLEPPPQSLSSSPSSAAGRQQLVTCTTVRDSHVVANVTCRRQRRRLVPDDKANADCERWLGAFFARVRLQRPIDGHIGFRFVRAGGGDLLPVGVRVGVPPAYICHTAVQTRVLMPPCRHFSRQRSGPLRLAGERYWMHAAVLAALRAPTMRALAALVAGPLLDGGEALFAWRDPLPWLAYCGWQLPRTVGGWWWSGRQRQQRRRK